MCGIAAILSSSGAADLAPIQAATELIRHRGPDDEGFVLFAGGNGPPTLLGGEDSPGDLFSSPLPYAPRRVSPHAAQDALVALGHRRLSILDLTPAGHQPMSYEAGRYWIVYNGEIYNYVELRRELEALGHRFVSHSDTEVVLAAYAAWGTACQSRFDGMWAFLIYDARERVVFVSRDRFGIKPLYYTAWDRGLAFASEIKTLLHFPGVGRKADPARLYDYLIFGLTDWGAGTLFEGIRQLPAAHYMEFALGRAQEAISRPYWKLDPDRRVEDTFEEARDRIREQFLENIRLHLRSDVPVGAALSGGIDSSAIVMSIREVQSRDVDLHAFSYVAGEPGIDEEPWIDLVGGASRAIVHKVRPDPQELVSDLDHLICAQDEPFGSTSIYAQHRVFRKAREAGIKVMLDGQGADEIFAGYRFYLPARIASLIRSGQSSRAAALLRNASRLPGARLKDLLVQIGECFLSPALQKVVRPLVGKPLAPPWLRLSWFRDRAVAIRPMYHLRGLDPFRCRLQESFGRTILPSLLRYEDRNSMAFSIESRVPFLTARLVEYVFSLPAEYLIAPDGTSKSVFRSAMRGIVPQAVLERRDKIGFATPERSWFKILRPWIEKILDSDAARRIPALRMDALRSEWTSRAEGERSHDFTPWRWINLIRWADRYGVEF